MLSFNFVKMLLQIGFLFIQLVASFENHASLRKRKFHNLNIAKRHQVFCMSTGKLPMASSIFKVVGNELGRTFDIIIHAPIKRKAILLAHPVLVVILCLLASSKLGRSFGKGINQIFTVILRTMSKKSQNACALAVAFAKAKLVDKNLRTEESKQEETVKASVSDVRTKNNQGSVYTTDLKVKAKREEDKAASAAIRLKIAEVEAREIAYSQAQRLKKELAQKASLAKAQAIEVEDNRVMRIAGNSREMDSFRKLHDISFRRWNVEQTIASAKKLQVVDKHHVNLLDTNYNGVPKQNLGEAILSGAEIIGAKEKEVEAAAAAAKEKEVKNVAEKIVAAKVEEALRLTLKAAAEQAAKDAQLAYARQLKEKVAALKVLEDTDLYITLVIHSKIITLHQTRLNSSSLFID